MTFKADDVLIYRYSGRVCEMIVHHVEGDVIFTAAARCIAEFDWEFYEGGAQLASDGTIKDLRLHPNPDEVWASYCAAMLRGEVSD